MKLKYFSSGNTHIQSKLKFPQMMCVSFKKLQFFSQNMLINIFSQLLYCKACECYAILKYF